MAHGRVDRTSDLQKETTTSSVEWIHCKARGPSPSAEYLFSSSAIRIHPSLIVYSAQFSIPAKGQTWMKRHLLHYTTVPCANEQNKQKLWRNIDIRSTPLHTLRNLSPVPPLGSTPPDYHWH